MSLYAAILGCLVTTIVSASVCRAGSPATVRIESHSDTLAVETGSIRAMTDEVKFNARKDGKRLLQLNGHVRIVVGEARAIADSAEISLAADGASTLRLAGSVEIDHRDAQLTAKAAEIALAADGAAKLQLTGGVEVKSKDGKLTAESLTLDGASVVLKRDGSAGNPPKRER